MKRGGTRPIESGTSGGELAGPALGAAAGAALVLDEALSIRIVTPEVRRLLGIDVPLGVSAPKFLCGDAKHRPVAEALAAGRPIRTFISGPKPKRGDQLLEVRSLPFGGPGEPRGWLVLLDEAGERGDGPLLFHGMWAKSPRMKQVFHVIERVAAEDATVLVRGETGTGKELVAQAIHQLSPRSQGPMVALSCAALPANLLESELFGHARGAFTGAVKDTPGHMQRAHGGTLFLDEVAELPLELQAKLLRAIETRSVIPVGGREPIAVDVRLISATHRSLRAEVEAGRFRADLMYRLRVIPIFLPPLRERREDIALLLEKLIEEANATARRKVERVAPAALAALERHDWPGNVRELRNVLAYAYAIGKGPVLQSSDLPEELTDATPVDAARERASVDAEGRRILDALERAGGNKNRAAQVLGVSRVTLWRKLKALG